MIAKGVTWEGSLPAGSQGLARNQNGASCEPDLLGRSDLCPVALPHMQITIHMYDFSLTQVSLWHQTGYCNDLPLLVVACELQQWPSHSTSNDKQHLVYARLVFAHEISLSPQGIPS